MKREDDYLQRRSSIKELTDEQLEQRFWKLTGQVVNPLFELARDHTSPSIERSVLLRMGFSSLEAKQIVQNCVKYRLLGKGAGHVVLRFAQKKNLPYREAGLILADGREWDQAAAIFGKEGPA